MAEDETSEALALSVLARQRQLEELENFIDSNFICILCDRFESNDKDTVKEHILKECPDYNE